MQLSQTSPLIFGLPARDVLLFCGVLAGPLLGFFGARFTAVARLEKTLLDASRQWVEELQDRHARDSAHISGQDETIIRLKAEIIRLEGAVNGHIQTEASLRNFIRRSGQEPPPRFPTIRED